MSNWERCTDLSEQFLQVQARVHSIPPNDVEDIRQNIVLHILRHQASVTVMSTAELEDFIDRIVSKYTKRWKRYRKKFKSTEDDYVPTVNETRQGELSELGLTILKLDVAAILERLTSRQQTICQCLIDDKTPRRIVWIVKCSQATMKTERDKIRQRFQECDYCYPHAN